MPGLGDLDHVRLKDEKLDKRSTKSALIILEAITEKTGVLDSIQL